jgi:hypothetical protein
MNKCYFQRWESSVRDSGVYPNGCSLHIDSNEHSTYVDCIYSSRGDKVPEEYERTSGRPIICYISDGLFELVKSSGSFYIHESGLSNMLDMCDISFRY